MFEWNVIFTLFEFVLCKVSVHVWWMSVSEAEKMEIIENNEENFYRNQ